MKHSAMLRRPLEKIIDMAEDLGLEWTMPGEAIFKRHSFKLMLIKRIFNYEASYR